MIALANGQSQSGAPDLILLGLMVIVAVVLWVTR